MPSVSRRFAGHSFGSDANAATEAATRDFLSTLVQSSAGLAQDTRQRGLDRTLLAAQAIPGVAGAETNRLSQLLSDGAVPRGVEQEGLTREFNEFLRRFVQAPQTRTSNILSLLGLSPVENIAIEDPGTQGIATRALQTFDILRG